MARSSNLRVASSIVARTPLLPYEVFSQWADGATLSAIVDRDDAVEQLAAIYEQQRERLRTILSDPAVAEAVFLASPSTASGLRRWLEDPSSSSAKATERTLVRYISRMCGRATPFGLFSGVSTGAVADTTRLEVGGRDGYSRKTRLDNDYLFSLCESLLADTAVRQRLHFFPNSSIYHSGHRLRFVQAQTAGRNRDYNLVGVETTPYIECILERSQRGATVAALAEAIVAFDSEIELDEAAEFIHELIDLQLLVSRLTPNVTGPQPLDGVLEVLDETEAAPAARDALAKVRSSLAAIDSSPIGGAQQRYKEIATELESLPPKVEIARLFQVDMVKAAPALKLGKNVIEEIDQAINVLHKLTPRPSKGALDEFREAFQERYEGREIPLAVAIDDEAGVGFANTGTSDLNPLLAGLKFPSGPETPSSSWSPREAKLARMVHAALLAGNRELVLTDADVESLEVKDNPPLPRSVAVMPTLRADDDDAINRGDFELFLNFVSGPSSARLLGRFCQAAPALEELVRQELRAEEALEPDTIFAEVAHLPEGRVGNILCRPVLRDYEIPYLGISGAAPEKQIPLGDLRVSVSDDGQVVLRSATLNREVIPRLTTAHAVGPGSLGVYRFLDALQYQGVHSASWEWGPLGELKFLPRVRYGRVIFSRARWVLEKSEIEAIADASRAVDKAKSKETLARHRLDLAKVVQTLRSARALPRFVAVVQADNELVVDFENALSVESFAHFARSKEYLVLFEPKSDPERPTASGPEGHFAHELIILFSAESSSATTQREPHRRAAAHQRAFPPGSEWLYAKFYCGSIAADRVIEAAQACLQPLLESDTIDHWFFLRYYDPHPHVRLRMHGQPSALLARALPALRDSVADLVEREEIWKFQLDTYVRETERYGGAEAIELCERIFHIDSEIVARIIALLDGDEGAEARWKLGLRGAAAYLRDFRFQEPVKSARATADGFAEEFHVDTSFRKDLGTKFRALRDDILFLVQPEAEDRGHDLEPGLVLLRERSERVAPYIDSLAELAGRGKLISSPIVLCWSVIHMHLNRLLLSEQRQQEVVIYDFLRRGFESLNAMAKKKR